MIQINREIRESMYAENQWNFLKPTIDRGGVYLLYDKDDYLIYIGQSKNVNNRLMSHCKNQNKDWSYAKVICIPSKNIRIIMEKILLTHMNPANNVYTPQLSDLELNLDLHKIWFFQKMALDAVIKIKELYKLIDEDDVKVACAVADIDIKLYELYTKLGNYSDYLEIFKNNERLD